LSPEKIGFGWLNVNGDTQLDPGNRTFTASAAAHSEHTHEGRPPVDAFDTIGPDPHPFHTAKRTCLKARAED
jgi:hypothetical protein